MKEWPKSIFLQGCDEDWCEGNCYDGDTTWCVDRINKNDREYTLAEPLIERIEKLEQQLSSSKREVVEECANIATRLREGYIYDAEIEYGTKIKGYEYSDLVEVAIRQHFKEKRDVL